MKLEILKLEKSNYEAFKKLEKDRQKIDEKDYLIQIEILTNEKEYIE